MNHPQIGVSTWAVHQTLGAPPIFGVEAKNTIPNPPAKPTQISLLELPEVLAIQGFHSLQICHFHLPTRDTIYLQELNFAIQTSGLKLHAILVDEGDITHPENGERDTNWIKDWLPIAAALGAENVRVIAGKTVDDDALQRSATTLKFMATQAKIEGVSIITENWFDLLSSPSAVQELLESCEDQVGFLLDSSNWRGPENHANLSQIAPFARSCHFHTQFQPSGKLDENEASAFLNLPFHPDFKGPFILVNGELEGIGPIRDFIIQATS